jgi:hypothetical protein
MVNVQLYTCVNATINDTVIMIFRDVTSCIFIATKFLEEPVFFTVT